MILLGSSDLGLLSELSVAIVLAWSEIAKSQVVCDIALILILIILGLTSPTWHLIHM